MWNKEKIDKHKEAARLFNRIKDEAFALILENKKITKYEVKQFILKRYKKYKLKTDCDDCIVAFGKIHYMFIIIHFNIVYAWSEKV